MIRTLFDHGRERSPLNELPVPSLLSTQTNHLSRSYSFGRSQLGDLHFGHTRGRSLSREIHMCPQRQVHWKTVIFFAPNTPAGGLTFFMPSDMTALPTVITTKVYSHDTWASTLRYILKYTPEC
jgi:hypothetical protein